MVRSILGAAGLTDVGFIDVQEPVHYGPGSATACDIVRDMQMTAALLAGQDNEQDLITSTERTALITAAAARTRSDLARRRGPRV